MLLEVIRAFAILQMRKARLRQVKFFSFNETMGFITVHK